jgi:hypothetical protein
MTRTVKVALYGLRIYLIVLLSLILLKFVTTFAGTEVKPPLNGVEPEGRPAVGRPAEP